MSKRQPIEICIDCNIGGRVRSSLRYWNKVIHIPCIYGYVLVADMASALVALVDVFPVDALALLSAYRGAALS